MRDFIVKIAQKLGVYKLLVDIDTYFINKNKIKNFRKYGIEAFVKMDEVCRQLNIQLLPIFGTHLGFYRDKGFISFDNDIDTAMLFSQRPSNFIEIMNQSGFCIETSYFKQGDNINLIEQYSYKGVHIDIFYLFDKSDSEWLCYVVERHEYKDWKEANRTDGFPCHLWHLSKCELTEQTFFNHNFYMPTKSEEWLKNIFGNDFMTPIQKWTVGNHKTGVILTDQRLYRKQWK